jgi:hypothetical protein
MKPQTLDGVSGRGRVCSRCPEFISGMAKIHFLKPLASMLLLSLKSSAFVSVITVSMVLTATAAPTMAPHVFVTVIFALTATLIPTNVPVQIIATAGVTRANAAKLVTEPAGVSVTIAWIATVQAENVTRIANVAVMILAGIAQSVTPRAMRMTRTSANVIVTDVPPATSVDPTPTVTAMTVAVIAWNAIATVMSVTIATQIAMTVIANAMIAVRTATTATQMRRTMDRLINLRSTRLSELRSAFRLH